MSTTSSMNRTRNSSIRSVALQSIPNPSPQVSEELISLRNEENFILEEIIEVNDLLGATSNPDTLIGGAGLDTLYGGATATVFEGGTGNDTFVYNPAVPIASDMWYAGASGVGVNTLMFQDATPGDTIGLGLDSSGQAIQVTMGSGSNAQTYDWTIQQGFPNASTPYGILVLGVNALGSGDNVTLNFGQSAAMQVSVQLGAGNDTIDASTFQGQETLRGGSGNDTIMIGTQLTKGDVLNGGTGNSELDISATGQANNVVTVSGGASQSAMHRPSSRTETSPPGTASR